MKMTKLDALLPIDRFWLVDRAFADMAVSQLANIDINAGVETDLEAKTESNLYEVLSGGIARILVTGPITKKETSVSYWFGGTSSIRTKRAVQEAVRDESVNSIVIIFDSPGGQSAGTAELAEAVREARKTKNITALISDLCCSAAYWVAAQATEVVANEMAMIGSIGCYTVVYDTSKAAEMAGVAVTLVTTGELKGQGVQGVPVSDDYITETQYMVDAIKDKFVSDIALGRGMDTKAVQKLATGAVWRADDAKSLRLIDRIANEDQVLEKMQRGEFPTRAEAAGKGTPTMAENQENKGLLARIQSAVSVALAQTLGGSDTTAAGADPSPVATTQPETNSSLIDQINALKANKAESDAKLLAFAENLAVQASSGFVTDSVRAGKALPVEAESLAGLYIAALKSDGGGSFAVKDGSLVKGPMTLLLESNIESRPSINVSSTTISNLPVGASTIAPEQKADLTSQWLSLNDTGKATVKRITEAK